MPWYPCHPHSNFYPCSYFPTPVTPHSPAYAEPVTNVIPPLVVPPLLVCNVSPPLPADVDAPDLTVTLPPTPVPVAPAVNVAAPPLAVIAVPTVMVRSPPLPLVLSPVVREREPEVPVLGPVAIWVGGDSGRKFEWR